MRKKKVKMCKAIYKIWGRTAKCLNMKNACAKCAKLWLFFVKYAHLWRWCSCLSFLLFQKTQRYLLTCSLSFFGTDQLCPSTSFIQQGIHFYWWLIRSSRSQEQSQGNITKSFWLALGNCSHPSLNDILLFPLTHQIGCFCSGWLSWAPLFLSLQWTLLLIDCLDSDVWTCTVS